MPIGDIYRGVPRSVLNRVGGGTTEQPASSGGSQNERFSALIQQMRDSLIERGGTPQSVSTRLGDVAFAGAPDLRTSFGTVEELIESRSPLARDLIRQGTDEAIRLSERGREEGAGLLEPFFDTRAMEERDALLGLSGAQAQEQAIGNIPVTEFDRVLQDRQRRSLARRQQAAGDLGGGSSIAELSQLGAQQQSQQIQNRLNQLSPLVQASRGVASSLSSIDMEELLRQAQLEQAAGVQSANVRLGTTAPVLSSIQNRGELSGLRAISSANQRADIANQLASVVPQLVQGYQNYQTNQAVNADLNASFANNPDIF